MRYFYLLDILYDASAPEEKRKAAYKELKELLTILKSNTTTKWLTLQDENDRDFDYCEINGKRVHFNDYTIVDELLREK